MPPFPTVTLVGNERIRSLLAVQQNVVTISGGFNWHVFTASDTAGCFVCDVADLLGDGYQHIQTMLTLNIQLPIACLTEGPASAKTIRHAIELGVTAVVDATEAEELNRTVALALERDQKQTTLRQGIHSWSEREREVICELLKGASSKSVASRLGISYQTVDKHKQSCLKKVQLRSVIELAVALNERQLDWLNRSVRQIDRADGVST